LAFYFGFLFWLFILAFYFGFLFWLFVLAFCFGFLFWLFILAFWLERGLYKHRRKTYFVPTRKKAYDTHETGLFLSWFG
jgi:hypothetical protein